MRQYGIVLPQFFAQEVQRFFWLSLPSDQSKRPIRDFLLAGVPFIGPGKEDRARETAFNHTIDMPAQHFRLLVLSVPDRVHSEFAKDKRAFLGEILQSKEIPLEVALIVQVNVEAKEIDVLRQQKFGRRIGGVGIQRTRIQIATDVDEMLDEFSDATHT